MEMATILKVVLAAVLGGMIGLERELSHKEAGLRTNMLIALGSALFTVISLKISLLGKGGDPSRVAAQIVTGIGFLGAGSIIQARFSVHGLTTAASIWTVAAIGVTVGTGYYLPAFLITLFVLAVLNLSKWLTRWIELQKQNFVYLITIQDQMNILIELKKVLIDLNIHCLSSRLSKGSQGYEYEITFQTSEYKNKEFMEKAMLIQGVCTLAWENL